MTDTNAIQNSLLFANDSSRRRPQQIALSNTATKAVMEEKNAILQGATGIGKTRALLSSLIEYLLSNPKNKAIYAVRTIGQLLQVEEEYIESNISSLLEDGAIRLGVSLGVFPMREKVCSKHSGSREGGTCNTCVLEEQKFSHSVLAGPCQSKNYAHAERIGVCPYSYMRTNLPKCNLIITTMGSLNQKQWILRNIGAEEEWTNTVVVIDEAHSYLSDMINIPSATVTIDPSDACIHAFSQRASELLLSKTFDGFHKKLKKLVAWFVLRDKLEKECGTVAAQNMNELYTILISHLKTKWQNRQDLKELRDKTLEFVRIARRGERPPLELYIALDRILDANEGQFVSVVEAYLNAYSEWEAVRKIHNDAKIIKEQISREKDELEERRREAWLSYRRSQDAFNEASRVFRSVKEERNIAYTRKQQCHENKDYTDFENIKNRFKSLQFECDLLWQQKEERKRLAFRAKSLYVEEQETIRIAKQKGEEAKELWREICNLQQVAFNAKNQAYENLKSICRNVFDSLNEAEASSRRLNELKQELDAIRNEFELGIQEGCRQAENVHVSHAVSVCLLVRKAICNIGNIIEKVLLHSDEGSRVSLLDIWDTGDSSSIHEAIQGIKSLQNDYGVSNTFWTVDSLQILETIYDACVTPERFWVVKEDEGNSIQVHFFDLDIEKKVSSFVGGFRSVILISATLEPLDKTAQMLGWQNVITQAYDSPFSEDNYLSYLIAGVHSGVLNPATYERVDSRQMHLIRQYLPRIVSVINGNIGIFVASENLLYQIYSMLGSDDAWPTNCRHLVLSQKYSDISDDYEMLAESTGIPSSKTLGANAKWPEILKAEHDFPICVWMACAGKYGEGIDFPGKMLEACILLGIPFPNLSIDRDVCDARARYYSRFKSYAQKIMVEELTRIVFPYRKLAQAAGRVHRRKTDVGALFFWDERLLGVKHDQRSGKDRFTAYLSQETVRERMSILPKNVVNTLKVADLTFNSNKESIVRNAAKSIGISSVLYGHEFIEDFQEDWHRRKSR